MDGITITVVGMMTVFAFLGILVVSMAVLRALVTRFARADPDELPSAAIAAVVAAAIHAARASAASRKEKA